MTPFGEITILVSSGKNRAYQITQQFTYVGKDKDCDIRIENSVCARKQFLLTANGNGTVQIQNLSKKYATQVNQNPIGFQVDHDLKENDTITAAGKTIKWSYQTSNVEELPRIRPWKRTRNSEPAPKIAVVTPTRREVVVNDEEGLPQTKRRRTLLDSSVRSTPHHCSDIRILPEKSCFARRVSYDQMLRAKTTPTRGRLTSGTPGRLAGKNNTKLSFAHPLESPNLVYYHDAAFNNSITPRTFYSGRTSNAPFTFRGFNPVAEESSSSVLGEDRSYSSINERNAPGRRSGRVSTPLHKKTSFQSARTSRNRSILNTGTPSVYFPTIQEGTYSEADDRQNAQLSDPYLYTNSRTLASSLNDPSGCDSTPASYFSPTSSGPPRMMRAESPNTHDANGVPRSPYRGRRTGGGDLVYSGHSTPFGTPQEVFHQSQQHSSLFVNTSRRSQLRGRRSEGSFSANQNHYGSHDSILQSPQSRTINSYSYLNSPRRSRNVVDTPGSSTFSPMSYNDTDYVLLSPSGRNLVNRRYDTNDQSLFSQSPYSPSQNTLDFTASPLQHPTPRFAKTPKRSLSIHVLTKSLQKKANYDFNESNKSSPKRRKSQRQSQHNASISRSASIPLLTSTHDSSDYSLTNKTLADITANQPSVVGGSDPSMLNFNSNRASSSYKSPRSSTRGKKSSSRVSRRSLSAPSGLNSSPKTRKSGGKVSTGVSPPGSAALVNLSSKSRKSGNATSEVGVADVSVPQISKEGGRPSVTTSKRNSRRSLGQNEFTSGVHQTLEQSASFVLIDEESAPTRSTRQSQHVQSPKSVLSSSARKSGKSSIVDSLEPISPSASSQSLKPAPGSRSFRLSLGQNASLGRVSRQSSEISSGIPTQSNSARRSQKSGTHVEPLVALSGDELIQEEKTHPCWVSLRSQSVPSGMPTQSSSARKSRKSVTEITQINSEPKVATKGNIQGQEENRLSKVSRRSRSVPSGTPTQTSSARKSRKSDTGSAEDNPKPNVASTSITPDQKEKNLSSRVTRQSAGDPSGAPTQASSARKSRKSVTRSAEDISEHNVPSTSYTQSQKEQHPLSHITRRSTGVPSGTPTRLSSTGKSKKSCSLSAEDISELSSGSVADKINQEEIQVSNRSPSIPSVTPAHKSKQSVESHESKDTLSPRVTRRSLASSLPQLNSPSCRKSDRGSPKENVKLIPEVDIISPCRNSLRDESPSQRVSQLTHSSPQGSPARKTGLNTPEKRITPNRTAASVLASTSSATLELDQSTSRSGRKRSLRNQTETSNVSDVKPFVTENGSLKWPVLVPTNPSAVMQISEDVKPSTSYAVRISKSESPKANSPLKLCSSCEADDDTSAGFTNVSAFISPLTTIASSTPALSNAKKPTKVTSTPFPKGLISVRKVSQISLKSTLPIEVDTTATSHLSSYTLSDSPHYDTISDEGLFDVIDAPGTSARTSLITKPHRRNSKRSVSFVGIKSGDKSSKPKTPPSKNVTIKEEIIAPELTPPSTSLEVNLRSSRKTSTAKKPSPSTPLTAGRAARLDNRLSKSFSEVPEVRIISPEKNPACSSSPLATPLKTLTSPARRSLDKAGAFINNRKSLADVPGTSTQSPKTPNSAPDKVTPPRSQSPEVTLRSSRKSATRSVLLGVPGTPKSAFRKNPRRSSKKASPSARLLKKKLDSIKPPGNSAIKKLKLDPDKPDKKKMAALWVCHKKKSGKSPVTPKQSEARRSFEKLSKCPAKLNMSVPKNFRFQTSDSASTSSSLDVNCADTSGKSLTPLKDLDVQPQQLSPEDDLLNALDLSRKSSVVLEPQKPSRRLRSSTRRLTPAVSSTPVLPGPETPSCAMSAKKLLFRSPLVDYEGSQPRRELQVVTSSSVKSILIPSPTRSSDEPMSRVFTTSPVVDFTDSTGKKKIFRASPSSKRGGIRELLPSEEIDLTGVRDLFEPPSSPSVVLSGGVRKRRVRKGFVAEDQEISPPKVAKLSPVATSSFTESVVNVVIQGASPPKLRVRKLRNDARSSKSPQNSTRGKAKKVNVNKVEKKEVVPTRRVAEDQGISPPKGAKISPVATSSVTESVVNAALQGAPPKVLVRKLRSDARSSKSPQNSTRGKAKNVDNVEAKKVVPTKKPFRASVAAAKAAVKTKAVGSKKSKSPKGSSSPKKLRSKKVETPEASSEVLTRKTRACKAESPKKQGSKNVQTSEQVKPLKGSSNQRGTASKDSPKEKTASEASPKKESSANKKSSAKTPVKKRSASKDSPKKESSVNKKSKDKTSAKKKLASNGSPKKASTSREYPKKTPVSEKPLKKESSANKKSSAKTPVKKKSASKDTPKKASPSKVSPKKLRTKNGSLSNEAVVKPSTSKKASPEKSAKRGPKSKRDSGKKTRVKEAARPKTRVGVSPRKTRSAAKPKKDSPKKASQTRRKR